jgi:hypothetical protein
VTADPRAPPQREWDAAIARIREERGGGAGPGGAAVHFVPL